MDGRKEERKRRDRRKVKYRIEGRKGKNGRWGREERERLVGL